MNPAPSEFTKNRILAALPEDAFQRVLPLLDVVSLKIKDHLLEPGKPIEFVYFPLSGMASILVDMKDGSMIEAGIVGYEGIVGLEVFLGFDISHMRSFYQVSGDVARMRTENFKAEVSQNPLLVQHLKHFNLAYMSLLAQNIACNSQHTILQRCARWLMLTQDRVKMQRFELTQEFIGQMLGVRRAGVSEAMQTLQDGGAIRYSRGMIEIADRAKLEQASCECYAKVTSSYAQILNSP